MRCGSTSRLSANGISVSLDAIAERSHFVDSVTRQRSLRVWDKLAPQQKSGILVCYKEVISFG
ncbi:hypothetical protein M595_0895 [Lyngbya aestuarii BL J]|uniref:Uncharacterized protein n=1 Tax=Lyngbya aestuarii BL J TaxID=1348334 RepID=U7QMI9_9CYAN|nr:hypothetical protein M595_0895 [Lyngbya aestuarii BL J]